LINLNGPDFPWWALLPIVGYVTAPRTWVAGELVTAGMMNTLRDLFLEIEAGTAEMNKVTLEGRSSAQLAAALSVADQAAIAFDKDLDRLVASLNGGAFAGLTAGVHDFPIPNAAWRPLPTGGCGWHEDATSTNNISGMPFDPTTSEGAYCWVRMPKCWNEGTFTFEVDTFNKAGGSGNFVFSLAALAVSDDDGIATAVGTAISVTDTALAAYDRQRSPVSAAVTAAGTPAANDLVLLVLKRLPADAGDTYGSDVYMHNVTLFITTDADNDV
jgi:hypothetical protein